MHARIPPPHYLATGVGALPHTDPGKGCRLVSSLFPRFPFVPTLPRRELYERIVFADSAYLPGRKVVGERLFVDTRADLSLEIERIYRDYLEANFAAYAAAREHTPAFYELMEHPPVHPLVFKCQVTGPVTFGMQVTDCDKRPLFYDSQFADVLGKLLGLQALWFERTMRRCTSAEATLVVFNEPYLSSLGSSVVPLDRDTVTGALTDAASLLEGGYGIHCCANTDWEFLLSLEPAVLSFDAYLLSKEFLLYGEAIASYLEKGGVIAWGIVPVEYPVFKGESVRALFERLLQIRSRLCEFVSPDLFDRQALITPACGIQFGNESEAEDILSATTELSRMCQEAFP